MRRAIIRNLILVLGVGVPLVVIAALFGMRFLPPTWSSLGGVCASASCFAAAFVLWYVTLALPIGAFVLVHQLVLALLISRGLRFPERAYSVAIALAMGLGVGIFIGVTSTDRASLIGVLLISSIVFALVTRPLARPGPIRGAAR